MHEVKHNGTATVHGVMLGKAADCKVQELL